MQSRDWRVLLSPHLIKQQQSISMIKLDICKAFLLKNTCAYGCVHSNVVSMESGAF